MLTLTYVSRLVRPLPNLTPMQVHFSKTTEQFLLAAKQAELITLQHLASNCQIVAQISDLIHQLQRERGISNIYLASHSGHYSNERAAQLPQTFTSEQQLRTLLSQHFLPLTAGNGASRLMHCISLSLQGLDNLMGLRQQITAQQIAPLQCAQAFCRLISSLLQLVADVAEGAGEPQITRLLVALFNLMQAKEYAGQERAWGAMGFASGRFDAALCERLQQLQYAQHEQLQSARELAGSLWQDTHFTEHLSGCPDFQQLRKLMQRLSDGTEVAAALCEAWFELATKRIDQLYQVEQELLIHLQQKAQQKLIASKAAMQHHRQQMRSLSERTASPEHPTSLLFDPTQPGLFGTLPEPALAVLASDGAGLHRTFYDLLQEQAQHIQLMQQQLHLAKQALMEQKQVDRAKLLLMQQSKLTEQQAYRQLQQLAMNSQQSLPDVAAAVIASHNRN